MTHIILISFFFFFGFSSSSGDGEMTDSSGCFATDRKDQGRESSVLTVGSEIYLTPSFSGQPCLFPFSDQEGTLHHHCTTSGDAYEEKWCATQTDQDHSVIEWGHCSPGCPDSPEGQKNINIELYFLTDPL